MFKLFKKRNNGDATKELARQLSIYQRQALAMPGAAGPIGLATYDLMERDSMIQCALGVKKLGVLAAEWTLEGGSGPVREFIQRMFERMEGSAEDILRSAMDAFSKGWSVQELIFSFDAGRIWLDAVHPKDPATFGIEVDAYGGVRGLNLELPGEARQPLPIAKFVVWRNRGGYGRVKGRSDLDAAYQHWQAKQTLLSAWKFHLERFAMPTVLGRCASTVSSDNRSNLVNALRDIQNNTSLVVPDDIEVSTLNVSKDSSTGFMDAIDFHNREMARAILGQTLTTDEGRRVGSLAMGKVHLQVLLLQLQSLRNELADVVMTEQVIRPLVELNFGPVEVPRFQFVNTSLEAFTTGAI